MTFRMNDAHGNDFLRTTFWQDHPECRLPNGALDFSRAEVRDYVGTLIEEVADRYDAGRDRIGFPALPGLLRAELPALHRGADRADRWTGGTGSPASGPPWSRPGTSIRAFGTGSLGPGTRRPTPSQCLARAAIPPDGPGAVGWISSPSVNGCSPPTPWTSGRGRPRFPAFPFTPASNRNGAPPRKAIRCEFCLSAPRDTAAAPRASDGRTARTESLQLRHDPRMARTVGASVEVLREIGDPVGLAKLPAAPWDTNRPIATVSAERYRQHPRPRSAALGSMTYVGPGLQRRNGALSSPGTTWRRSRRPAGRATMDGRGRNGSHNNPPVGTPRRSERGGREAGRSFTTLRRDCSCNRGSGRSSATDASTTGPISEPPQTRAAPGPPQSLRYEDGPEFDPANPAAEEFLSRNQGYPGSNVAPLPDGSSSWHWRMPMRRGSEERDSGVANGIHIVPRTLGRRRRTPCLDGRSAH